MRVMARVTESSARCARTKTPSCSRVNQAEVDASAFGAHLAALIDQQPELELVAHNLSTVCLRAGPPLVKPVSVRAVMQPSRKLQLVVPSCRGRATRHRSCGAAAGISSEPSAISVSAAALLVGGARRQ
jgi:hypothetical protein